MPNYTLWRLVPKAPFHLGIMDEGGSSVIAHSDTLFSAIANAYRLLYGSEELESLLKKFFEAPPFIITSTFPYIDNICLFPMPKGINRSALTDDPREFKKLEFVSEEILKKIIRGGDVEEDFNAENLIKEKTVLLTSGEAQKIKSLEPFWVKRERPRVAIDRETSFSQIYYASEVVFQQKCGLFFLMDLRDDSVSCKVEAAVRLLGDEGLGGDRTYGMGLFDARKETYFLPNGGGELNTTLSLVYPEKGDLNGLMGRYSLLRRGGWIYSQDGRTLRKKTVRMFGEGSTFNKMIPGVLKDVTPEEFTAHNILRYGLGFYINTVGSI